MTLGIDIDKVAWVMIGGQWHKVKWERYTNMKDKSTFYIDAYEFIEKHMTDEDVEVYQGDETLGFGFKTSGNVYIYGPFSQIQAVRTE